MKLPNLKIFKNAIILNVIIILMATLEAYFVTLPNINKIKNIQQDIASQLAIVDAQLQLGQNIKKLSHDLKKIEPFLEKLSTVFLKSNDQLTLITTLEDLAKTSNLEINLSLSDLPEENKNNIVQIPLQITLSGAYQANIDFLLALEQLPFYINITAISMNSNLNETEQVITTSIVGNTYWQI